VKWACAGDKGNFFSREKKFPLSPAPPFFFKKSGEFCGSRWLRQVNCGNMIIFFDLAFYFCRALEIFITLLQCGQLNNT